MDSKVFFINNEGFEIVQGQYNRQVDDVIKKIPTLELVKKAPAVASIFGEGSLSMIVAILALVASGVSIFLTVYYNKKKSVPVAANGASESDDDE